MSEIRVDTVSEKTSANGVAIDSVTLKDGGITATAASTITVADNSDTLSLISTDADANAGPVLRLFRNSASPADDDVAGSIVFSGEDDGSNETDYASIKVITEDVTDGTEDGRLSFNIIDGGSAVEVMSIFDNFVGIGTTAPEQVLHVHGGDSGSSYSADNADRLIIENNDSLRIDMRTGTSNTVGIMFSDTTRNRASINYSHSTDHMTLTHEGDKSFVMGGGRTQTGGETSGDVSAGGLCLNMGANDAQILSFKSSDIDHGITSGTGNNAENDTYGSIKKVDSNNGGCKLSGYTEGSSVMAIELFGYTTTPDSAFSVSSQGIVQIRAVEKSGSSYTGVGNDDNMFAVKNDGSTKFIVRGDGDIGHDGSASAFDEYEDAHLARALDLSHGNGVIDSKFDQFVKYNHEDLAKIGLVGREKDGTPNHFINITGFQRLHNGAIWQQYEKHQRLAEAVYEMAKEVLGEDKANAILEKHDIKLLN